MKFKVLKGTELYDKFVAMRDRIAEVRNAADQLVKSLGYKQSAIRSSMGYRIAGGIDAIECDSKPEGWKQVGESWQKFYFPKSIPKNKALLKQIAELPIVKTADVNALIGFKFQTISANGGLCVVHSFGWHVGPKCTLIEITDGVKFKPVIGMIEILDSEYQRLKNNIIRLEEAAQGTAES